MNFAIAKAAEIVIMPRFSLEEALQLIARTRPTVMPGVGHFLMAEDPEEFNRLLERAVRELTRP